MTLSTLKWFLVAVTLTTLVLSAAAYFRVLFTDAGYESVGRTWYYFRDYAAFGFTPGSLLGTLLSPFMSYPVLEHHVLAWTIQGGILLIAFGLVLFANLRYVWPVSAPWAIVLLSAISIMPHMAYNLGNLDNVLAILAIVSVFSLRHTWVLVAVCAMGPLFHSIFVFAIYPCLFLLVFLQRGVSWHLGVVGATMVSMVGVVAFVTAPALDEAAYSALLWERVPGITRDGSFEYLASIQDSFHVTWQERRDFGFPILWFVLALLNVAILVIGTKSEKDRVVDFILRAIVLSTPLIVTVFITDIYRATAWVGFNVMLYVIYLVLHRPRSEITMTLAHQRPGLFLAAVLPWMALGPMGVTCYGQCGATAFPFFKQVLDA